jgi:hypothetical protein
VAGLHAAGSEQNERSALDKRRHSGKLLPSVSARSTGENNCPFRCSLLFFRLFRLFVVFFFAANKHTAACLHLAETVGALVLEQNRLVREACLLLASIKHPHRKTLRANDQRCKELTGADGVNGALATNVAKSEQRTEALRERPDSHQPHGIKALPKKLTCLCPPQVAQLAR